MIGINPDNIATPISATLGDLVSLTLLSNIASLLYNPDGKKGFNLLKEISKLLLFCCPFVVPEQHVLLFFGGSFITLPISNE